MSTLPRGPAVSFTRAARTIHCVGTVNASELANAASAGGANRAPTAAQARRAAVKDYTDGVLAARAELAPVGPRGGVLADGDGDVVDGAGGQSVASAGAVSASGAPAPIELDELLPLDDFGELRSPDVNIASFIRRWKKKNRVYTPLKPMNRLARPLSSEDAD